MLQYSYILIVVMTIALVVYYILEFLRHKKNLSAIPIRVHVNGIRGKSSVTRLITAGLQAGGIRTFGKTTGSSPRMIFPDGEEIPIRRFGPANIIEQLKIIRLASKMKVEALVVECMAVNPELQWLCENKIVKSTLGVITNVRPDHLDEMGPTIDKVTDAISGTIPWGGKVFTAEKTNLGQLKWNSQKQNADLILADHEKLTDDEIENFNYVEHKENVALALEVAEHLGVSRDTALAGMWKANPDPGALKITRINFFEKHLEFINAFAANDPVSTGKIWKLVTAKKKDDQPVIVIANARADRISRTEQLAEMLAGQLTGDYYILVGGYTKLLNSLMTKLGVYDERIFDMSEDEPAEIFEQVLELTPHSSKVFAAGNIGGIGHRIIQYFENRGET